MVKQLHRKMIDCLPANDGPVLAGGRSLSGAKIKFSAGAGARGGGPTFALDGALRTPSQEPPAAMADSLPHAIRHQRHF